MADDQAVPNAPPAAPVEFYCPLCDRPVTDPLRCGDCGSWICRACGAPLEPADDLGLG